MNHDLFLKIDNETAYLAGWMLHTSRLDNDGSFTIRAKIEHVSHLKRLSLFFSNDTLPIIYESNGTCVYFSVLSEKMFRDFYSHDFRDIPEEFRFDLVRGFFDYYGVINVDDVSCKLGDQRNDFYEKFLKEWITIPFKIVYDESDIFFQGVNCIDFLGTLYNYDTCTSRLMLKENYDIFQKLVSISKCQIYKSDICAVVPCKSRFSDVGYDLTVFRKVEDLSNGAILYDTGIKLDIPIGMYAQVFPRSSLSKSGYVLANSVGIIDPSYRGSIMIALVKLNPETPDLVLPFRCCQLVFQKQYHVRMTLASEDFEKTDRGSEGFGSTG
jgi:deoxyuridine 5'-triphosphate nucleotidohydrolase